MNHNTKILAVILTSLGALVAGPLPTADQALLDVLLKNGVITKAQREALIDTKKSPAKPAGAISAKTAPADDQGLLDVLLENGLISQAQFAALQVKTAYSDNPSDFSDATQLRRARLSVTGTLFEDWDYKVEADLGGNNDN